MKQSRLMSLAESLINIGVGFGISVGAQAVVLPLLGVPIPLHANLAFAAVMTAISIARSFLLRRLFEALHIRRPLSPAMLAIIAERHRQREVEGWTAEHDAQHAPGDLARAGAAYALYAPAHLTYEASRNGSRWVLAMQAWPWSQDWWKPYGFRRDLVRSAALILADIERHDNGRKPAADTGAAA